jgi:hypothetical protein
VNHGCRLVLYVIFFCKCLISLHFIFIFLDLCFSGSAKKSWGEISSFSLYLCPGKILCYLSGLQFWLVNIMRDIYKFSLSSLLFYMELPTLFHCFSFTYKINHVISFWKLVKAVTFFFQHWKDFLWLMDALDHKSVSKVVHCMSPLLLIFIHSQTVYFRLTEGPKNCAFCDQYGWFWCQGIWFLLICKTNFTLFSMALKEKKSVDFHYLCYKNLCLWS